MANDAKNVSFGKPKAAGAVFLAPAGTTVPTDGATALDAAFKNLGYVSEDGLVNSIETDTENVNAWGGDLVLVGQTNYMETFQVNLLETNIDALKAFYGAANVTQTGQVITVRANSAQLPQMVAVFEVVMTGGRVKRIVVPNAQFVDRSAEITYVDGEAISYPLLLQAYPDSSGNSHSEYITLTAS